MEIKPILKTLLRHKISTFLIVFQTAITVAVVSNSVFLTVDMMQGWNQKTGIKEEEMIMVRPQAYDENFDIKHAVHTDLGNIRKIPGVINVTPIINFPFQGGTDQVYLETGEDAKEYLARIFDTNVDGPEVLGVQLVSGRIFTDDEVVEGGRSQIEQYPWVTMVSEDLAGELFPNGDALGKTIWLDKEGQSVEIIGIYKNIIAGESLIYREKSYHTLIRPLVVWEENFDPNYLIRTETGMTASLIEPVRDALYLLKGRYIHELEPLTLQKKRMYDGRGVSASILLVVSAVLIIINAFGVFGLVSFYVGQRKQQIGVRRALGATQWDIMRYYLLENTLVTFVGLLLGLCITLLIVFWLNQIADQSNIFNLIHLGFIALFFWVISLIAAWRPARIASAIDPAIVTRS